MSEHTNERVINYSTPITEFWILGKESLLWTETRKRCRYIQDKKNNGNTVTLSNYIDLLFNAASDLVFGAIFLLVVLFWGLILLICCIPVLALILGISPLIITIMIVICCYVRYCQVKEEVDIQV